jgi:hypothetical protein
MRLLVCDAWYKCLVQAGLTQVSMCPLLCLCEHCESCWRELSSSTSIWQVSLYQLLFACRIHRMIRLAFESK